MRLNRACKEIDTCREELKYWREIGCSREGLASQNLWEKVESLIYADILSQKVINSLIGDLDRRDFHALIKWRIDKKWGAILWSNPVMINWTFEPCVLGDKREKAPELVLQWSATRIEYVDRTSYESLSSLEQEGSKRHSLGWYPRCLKAVRRNDAFAKLFRIRSLWHWWLKRGLPLTVNDISPEYPQTEP